MRSVLFAAGILMSLNAYGFNEGTYPSDTSSQPGAGVMPVSQKSRAEVARDTARPDTDSPYVFHGDVLIDNPNFARGAAQRTDSGMTRQARPSAAELYIG